MQTRTQSERASSLTYVTPRPAALTSSSRARRLAGPVLFASSMALLTVALHVRDPHANGAWGKCPTLYITGFACPFCGGLRAVNDLTNGHLADAVSSNAALVLSLPFFAVWWMAVMSDRWRGRQRLWNWPLDDRRLLRGAVCILAVFTLVRNLPFGHVLYP